MDSLGGNRKLLTSLGRIGQAKFSPDGSQIVFERLVSEEPVYNWDIYLMNADGSNIRNITDSQDWVEFEPDWSPDGSKIAFRGRVTVDRFSKSYIMNADGSDRRLLADDYNSHREPTWSPNGKRLALIIYWSRGGSFWGDKGDIFSINSDGSGLTNLTNRGERFGSPCWSEDGNELIYGRSTTDPSTGEYWQVWRMNTDGTNQRCIIGCEGHSATYSNYPAAWKGSRILLSSWEAGNWDILIFNADGSGIQRLTDRPFDEKARDWRP